MRSIRRELTRSLLVALVALLLMGGVLGYFFARLSLVSNFDSALATKAEALATLVEFERGALELEFGDEVMPEFEPASGPSYFEIRLSSGEVFQRSRSLQGQDLPALLPAEDRTIHDVVLPGGERGRAIAVRFQARVSVDDVPPTAVDQVVGPTCDLVLAKSRNDLDKALASFARGIGLMEGCLLLAVLWIVRNRVRAGLEPLERLALDVGAIDAGSLHRRIAIAEQPVELSVVTERLNLLLARLEGAFERERRFSAAAAHELRTPVAELKTLAEVALRWPARGRSADETRCFSDVHDIACQIEGLINSLLLLARTGGRALAVEHATFVLAPAVEALLAGFFTAVYERSLDLHVDVPSDLAVSVHLPTFEIVLRNLIDNALTHAPRGTDVTIRAHRAGERIEIAISNRSPGLAQADLAHLFEPFWRKDEARTDGRHHGLGLSIVRALAEPLGLTVAAALEPAGRITMTASMPQAPASRRVSAGPPEPAAHVQAQASAATCTSTDAAKASRS